MNLNHDLIRARFEDIQQSLDRLEAMRDLPLETFLGDQDLRDVTHYRLLVAIESALQICYHVSARELRRVPEDYAACFALLGEAGLLPAPLSQNLQQMARFRNMLVHVYWQVDESQVYDLVQTHLGDLRAFVQAIGALLRPVRLAP
ncbi:MAG: type VII toxin-antitoxin system HepT family RNase toxin [Anaerolineae bacterium]